MNPLYKFQPTIISSNILINLFSIALMLGIYILELLFSFIVKNLSIYIKKWHYDLKWNIFIALLDDMFQPFVVILF